MDEHTMMPVQTWRDIKEAVSRNREATEKGRSAGEHYRVDRSFAHQYLDYRPWRRQIGRYFDRLQGQRKPIVYVDVCGRATGTSLGADWSYSFSLQRQNYYFPTPDHLAVEGDLLNAGDYGAFLRLLQEKGHRPALVTFEPIVGLQRYTPTRPLKPAEVSGLSTRLAEKLARQPRLHHEVTWQRLTNNLRRTIAVVRPGGYLYLSRPFQLVDGDEFFRGVPKEKRRLVVGMRAFCAEVRCDVEVITGMFGPHFLIHKPGRAR